MTRVHHLNAGTLRAPASPPVACHCLLLEDDHGLALVDSGIGLRDVWDPEGRIGRPLIEQVGFQFDERATAFRLIERLGLRPADVRHVALTHGDLDHTGGLADFPDAWVHLATEEHASVERGHARYLRPHFAHGPRWRLHPPSSRAWFGLEARPLRLGFASEVLLVPLFGHTHGHCGVAVAQGDRWVLHVGDAYYLRVELSTDDHPVSALTAARAVDDARRRESLAHLRRLARDRADQVTLLGYHDFSEFPEDPAPAPRVPVEAAPVV